ncbi:hybrid sensor histidine kinase/response regulator transcription factor [Hymenobacter rubidus]|uniref:hybrid sensor histidine kinase/response regulator transcription factor n=1 Tax=Hymenobacter rubidus TaxID=1441626 RepID=UPI00191DB710|nr:two-component regulator propeller domain-containing protein [Hymenobacter rubidus]
MLIWLALTARAQDTAPSEFRFEHLTVDQGLSHSDAMAVAQDRAGFIWVGTNRGLDRYDGYSLKTYTLPITREGVSGNRIKVLHLAPNGRLWVGTERAGLGYYDAATDKLTTLNEAAAPAAYRPLVRQLLGVSIMGLASDGQGQLWVGTQWAGLFVLAFDKQAHLATIRRVPFAANAPATYALSSLATDAEGNVWVGTYDHGLGVVRAGSTALAIEATAFTELVRVLQVDRRGDLWIGSDQRVFWVSAANRRAVRELTTHPQPIAYPQLQSMLLDSFGRLWVGTIYGLYVWEAGAVTGQAPPLRPAPTLLLPADGEPFSINSERVHQIFEDRTQVMWLCASAGGLNKVDLRQKPFGQLRRQRTGQTALANNYINAIYKEEATNTLWLGTRNGVQAYDLARQTYRSYTSKDGGTRGVDVSAVFKASNGTLWFGTRSRGLVSLTRQNGREKLTTYNQLPNGIRLNTINIERITEDRYGHLWVATYGAGLFKFSLSGEFLGNYRMENSGLPTNIFSFLLYDPHQDVLWASTTDQGLLKLRATPDSLQILRQLRHQPDAADGLLVNFVWPLLLDRQGTLWIGTIGGGLHQLNTDSQGRETVHNLHKYLPESDVESIMADDAGQLWIGGTGLYRYSPGTRRYLRYDVADGLQSNAFKVGAADRGADGTLYFGGINGVSYFQPATIQPNPHAPVVQLTGLRIASQPVAVGQPFNGRVLLTRPLSEPQTVVIRPGDNDFSVEFVGLNYANPQKNRYAYQLEGYNAGWVTPPPGQRSASFANLPPGQYTLRVKASNGEGSWSVQPAIMHFDVRAPWYKTAWAYGLYALLLLGAVALYRRIEMSQQQLKSRLVLEQFQAEKEKELTNLKLGFFTSISHELRTPLTLILGPMEDVISSLGAMVGVQTKVQLMQRQAQKLLDLVNQLLDFRKVETGNVPLRASYGNVLPFLTEQFASFQLKAQERAVHYQLQLPAEPVELFFDRSKLEIILTNLLANAFKYVRDKGRVELGASVVGDAGGNAVYEQGQLTGNYLKIMVSDTGVGIAPHELPRIFDPYYQASHTNTLRMTGTGIGLALAQQFAQRHGGQLTVASTQGVGTTFELRLPFGQQHLQPEDLAPAQPDLPNAAPTEPTPPPVPDEAAEPMAPTAVEPAPPAGPPHLLLVEDNDELREYLVQLFEADYQVITAEDGVVGWEKALAQLPDLIISDVMMPRSDGLELCQKIKQHPKTAHIPVLLLTARTAEIHQLEGLGMGADDYVSKPFNPTLLQAKAEGLLRNRRKLHEFYQRRILLQPTEIVVADADREFLEKAMGIVEKHLGDSDFNVQVLVGEMAMSNSIFYRRIKSITGQTVVEFIRDVRLKRAAQLLTQTTLRVAEVGFEVGIENAKYFRQMFQKLYGMTPSEYAKQHRDVANQVANED